MSLTMLIRPEAEADLAEAYTWYEERVPRLGSDFLLNIEAALSSIQRNPEAYPLIYKNVRRCLTRHFPFGIFCVFKGEKIIVVAVFHAKRDPRKWRERVKC